MFSLRRACSPCVRLSRTTSPVPAPHFCPTPVSQLRSYTHESRSADTNSDLGRMAYSRQDLMGWWHKAARNVSPGDVTWEGRDHLRAKCTILRADGTVEKSLTPVSKQSMIDDYSLQPRDLRSLDAHILDVRPTLLICQNSIVLCTPIARTVITHDHLILIGSDPSNPLVTDAENDELVEALQEVMAYLDVAARAAAHAGGPGSKASFEFRALEAFLLLTVRGFKEVSSDLHERVYGIIPQLRFGVSPAELRNLLESKRTIQDCLYSGRALQSAVSDVLGEDEDLVGMYLTDKHNKTPRSVDDHQTAELLLEYYERRLDESNESAVRLASLLADIDSNITLVLASTRVRLQNLELQTALTTLALAAGTALAGFFGMNLISGFETSPIAFYYATGTGVAFMALIMIVGWVRLLRARKSQLFLGSFMPQRQHKAALVRSSRNRQELPTTTCVQEAQKIGSAEAQKEEGEQKAQAEAEKEDGLGRKKDGSEI